MPKKTLAGAITALGLLTAAAPAQAAPQAAHVQQIIRATLTTATADGARTAPDGAVNATCTVGQLTENRFSECEDVAASVQVIKVVDGVPELEGTARFTIKHTMTLNSKSLNWTESFTVSKAAITGNAVGITVEMGATAGNGTAARAAFPEGHTLDSPAGGSVAYRTARISKGGINKKTQTTYRYAFVKPGYAPGGFSYKSGVYRCDNYYGTSGCAMPAVPTGVSMIGLPWIDWGIRQLRAHGGHWGDPYGGQALHWMLNSVQEGKNRAAVCPRQAPPAMVRVGRTSCDEYPFASTYEGGTHLPANQREITWVNPRENSAQGARITNWRRPMHVMDGDPFYVIA